MIRSKIVSNYPNHRSKMSDFAGTIYVADYSNSDVPQRGVEICCAAPTEYESLIIKNPKPLNISAVKFNDKSFQVTKNGTKMFRSQCECALFPTTSNEESWMLFAELKYCKPENNRVHLNKARRQLYKTRYYYLKEKPVFDSKNPCYLIVSFPEQSAPFSQTGFAPSYLQKLKSKHNVIFRASNSLEVIDDKLLRV